MKNICFLIGNIGLSGGTERVTSLIANALSLKGYTISILSLSEGSNSFFRLEPDIKLDMLFNKKVSMKKNFLSAVYKIRKYISENKIDTIIVVDSILCVFTVPALIGLKTKHICWEHFNFTVDLGVSFRRIGRKWAAKYCDYVITLTKRDKELWEDGLKNIKAKIIPISNPTPFESVSNIPNLESKVILAVGRLTYQKGFDLLISAWSKIFSDFPEWKIQIVGSGEDELKLKNMVKDHHLCNSVIFLGQQKNMDPLYRSASFFCMSSRFEGLPMVLLEAQSYGLPIVSFDCNTGPAELINHKINGLLAKDSDVESLAKEISFMINLKSNEFSKYSERTFTSSKLYDLDELIKLWFEIV